jgi:AraC-like DNA-binding protein
MGAVHYREYPPTPPLDRAIRCYWTLDQSADEGAEEKIVPDGCMEVVFHLAERMPRRFADGSVVEQPRSFVVGQLRGHVTLVPEGRIETLGIRLRPGGAFLLLGVPLDELVEESLPLEVLAPELFADVEERVANARGWAERVRTLDHVLHARLAPQLGASDASGLAERVADWIVRSGGALTVDALAARTGASRRTLERHFRREVGLGPKRLARIVRFQRAFERLGETPRPGWTAIAADCGYADQSHLVRDFREFTGEAPTAFLEGGHELSSHFTGLSEGQ